ncbi:MAG TPA: cytochrome c biogenesis protein ResB, partial [Planctomycetota bacterium]
GPEEELFRNLTETSGDMGALVLTVNGTTKVLDVRESLGKALEIGGRRVTLRQVLRSLTIGEGGRAEENPNLPDGNPTVIFDMEWGDRKESYYAFALLPGHSPMRRGAGMHSQEAPDFSAAYRYRPRMSRVWIFAFPEGLRYVITSSSGKSSSGSLPIGSRVKHPSMPMDFFIEAVRRIERAELTVQPEEPSKGRPANPAIRVRVAEKAAGESIWLMLGESAQVNLPGGAVSVEFAPRSFSDLGFAVELVRFKNPPYEGTGRASKFESDLSLRDLSTGAVITGTTGVNHPFTHNGWAFYQSAFNDRVRPVISILQVSYDPGKPVLYLGCIMVVSGTLFMLFLKPWLLRLFKSAKGSPAAPFGPAMTLGALVLLSVGTIGGMTALLASPTLSGLLVGALMAATGIAAAFLVAGAALRWSVRRPGPALEIGRLVSLGWCLNTAALVLLMWMRMY